MGKNGPEEIDATAEDYERVIACSYEYGYLDDSRFVARFIASRSRKGCCTCAPARTESAYFAKRSQKKECECDIDWCALARRSGDVITW